MVEEHTAFGIASYDAILLWICLAIAPDRLEALQEERRCLVLGKEVEGLVPAIASPPSTHAPKVPPPSKASVYRTQVAEPVIAHGYLTNK